MLRLLRGRSGSLSLRMLSTAAAAAPQPDVIIVGAGIIGCSIALSLNRRGLRTLNLDKGSGAGSGSTCFSSGIIRTFYTARESAKFAWEGLHYWEEWADHVGLKDGGGGGEAAACEGGLARMRTCGAVLPRTAASHDFLAKVIAHSLALGIPHEEWSAERAAAALGWDLGAYHPPTRVDHPDFGAASTPAPDGVRGAVHFPRTGYVSDPLLACQNIEAAARATGLAEFRYGAAAAVQHVRKDAGGARVVGVGTAGGDELRAPVVVNAAGPHSSKITALAFDYDDDDGGSITAGPPNDMRVSTRAMRQEVAYVPSPAGVDQDADGVVSADFDVGCYWRPEVGGRLLIGGAEPACDAPEWVDDPDALDESLTENWTNIVYRAALRMPGIQIPNTAAGVVAMYDVTEDWMPIYDKSALGGYYMAIGTSGNQFKSAPPAGELMAELITACEGGVDTDAEPVQLELRRTGHVLDTAIFSRLRVQDDGLTSGTVLG